MPSKIIHLKCKEPFVHEQIRSEPAKEQLGLARRGVGSYFANTTSQRPGTGLLDKEINILMPLLLGLSVENTKLKEEVNRFYTDINTLVPYGDRGLELEIGLMIDNNKPIDYSEKRVTIPYRPATEATDTTPALPEVKEVVETYYNLPIDVEDYIRYRHALNHPDVAPTLEDGRGNSTVKYFLEDPQDTLKKKYELTEMKDKAVNLYQEVKGDPDKVKMLLTLMRTDIDRKPGEIVIIANLVENERLLKLRKIAEDKPITFVKVASDPKLKYKYLLEQLITAGHLKKIGQSIIVDSTGDALGSNVDEAVYSLFEDARNSSLLGQLKTKMKEQKQIV